MRSHNENAKLSAKRVVFSLPHASESHTTIPFLRSSEKYLAAEGIITESSTSSSSRNAALRMRKRTGPVEDRYALEISGTVLSVLDYAKRLRVAHDALSEHDAILFELHAYNSRTCIFNHAWRQIDGIGIYVLRTPDRFFQLMWLNLIERDLDNCKNEIGNSFSRLIGVNLEKTAIELRANMLNLLGDGFRRMFIVEIPGLRTLNEKSTRFIISNGGMVGISNFELNYCIFDTMPAFKDGNEKQLYHSIIATGY